MIDDFSDLFDILPISNDRQGEIIKLTKTKDFRALLLNALLSSLNTQATTEFEAATKYAEARGLAKLLTTTLKPKKIEEQKETK